MYGDGGDGGDGDDDDDAHPNLLAAFICRSPQLQQMMQHMQSEYGDDLASLDLLLFDRLLDRLEAAIFAGEEVLGMVESGAKIDHFTPARNLQFKHFLDIFPEIKKDSELEPMIAWKQILSFIKGSKEAVAANRHLTQEEYLSEKSFPTELCRLSETQRTDAYNVYLRYERKREELGRWDDADRALDLHRRALELGSPRQEGFGPLEDEAYEKLYVDEVQDYTQAEIMLFCLAGVCVRWVMR